MSLAVSVVMLAIRHVLVTIAKVDLVQRALDDLSTPVSIDT